MLSLGLGLLTVVAAGAAAWAASGYALHAVRRMAHRADEWREHDLTGRFALGTPRDELTELADTLDRMLDRITQAILTERRLTDEVAHELRTPLSVIRTEAQLAQLEARPRRRPRGVPDRDRGGHGPDDVLDRDHARGGPLGARRRAALPAPRGAGPRPGARALAAPGSTWRSPTPARDVAVAAPLRVVVAALEPAAGQRGAARRRGRSACTSPPATAASSCTSRTTAPASTAHRRADIFEPGHSSDGDGAGLGLGLSRRLAHSVGGEVSERGDGPRPLRAVPAPGLSATAQTGRGGRNGQVVSRSRTAPWVP